MERMGFHSKWIGWIMECVKSVSYSILVNGEPKGHIIPTRGIRQGAPLFPYLFLLCSKGLNGLIEHAVDCKHIEGVSLCRNGPKISHLLFADDSLFFFVELEWGTWKKFKRFWEYMSGLQGKKLTQTRLLSFLTMIPHLIQRKN